MKKGCLIFLPLIMAVFITVSCGTPSAGVTPQQMTDTPSVQAAQAAQQQTPQPQTTQPAGVDPALDEARTRAQASRQQAMDFETPAYFPSEWEAIEAQFRAANNAAALNAAAAAYDELLKRTAPLYAQAREDEIMAARDELIATGVTGYFPEYLGTADNLALSALEQYEAGDYYGAKGSAAEALALYEDMLIAANIIVVREELTATGVTQYFPEYLSTADNLAYSAIDQYEAGNKAEAKETASAVMEQYQDMLFAANIIVLRENLVATGVPDSYPEILQYADEFALSALSQYEAGDKAEARKTAGEAMDLYQDLLFAARVYVVRDEIINRGFVRFDPDNISRADEVALSAVDEYQAGHRAIARGSAEEAMLRYNVVLANGWGGFAHYRRDSAARERHLALSERANIASRDNFREGDIFYNLAENLFSSNNYPDAAIAHLAAEAMFAISREDTRERRLRAEEAIRLAEEMIILSNEAAVEAERIIIEGGSR